MRLFEQGARGVQLFFVASAVTLLMSWHQRNDGYVPFVIRRLFRIVPLFWLAIPVYLLFAGLGPGYYVPPAGWSGFDIFRQVFFVDSFMPSIGSIVPGGWTVNTEMLFYAIFPILICFVKSLRIAIVAYLLTLVIAVGLYPVFFRFLCQLFPEIPQSLVAVWATLSLPMQLPVFLAGFVAFFCCRIKILFQSRIKSRSIFFFFLLSL